MVKRLNTDSTLGNCLFGSAKLTTDDDQKRYGYGGYGIGFDACSNCLWSEDS